MDSRAAGSVGVLLLDEPDAGTIAEAHQQGLGFRILLEMRTMPTGSVKWYMFLLQHAAGAYCFKIYREKFAEKLCLSFTKG